jgi:tetratricopeptide (TPR) repeat protein
VSPLAASLVVAALAAVAAAGVIAGFLRRDPAAIEPLGDPLQDRRLALLRSRSDLEEAHGSGALEDADYERLREDTDARMARLLRALERRGREPASEPALFERPAATLDPAVAEPRRVPPWAVAVLIGGIVSAMVVAALVRDTEPQIRASSPSATGSEGPLAFFEDRVRRHPEDLAARLDLAHRYLDAGRPEDALDEYAVALDLDPDDAEALAHVGMILYLGDRPQEALTSVDRALRTDPDYPEALFFRGVILLRGLGRPQEAIVAFERYLEAAPFGTERQTVQDLIVEARAAVTAR